MAHLVQDLEEKRYVWSRRTSHVVRIIGFRWDWYVLVMDKLLTDGCSVSERGIAMVEKVERRSKYFERF